MAKKRILIINKSFELGGVQMALVNMLEAIHDEYEITLAVFNPNGPLKERIPSDVKLLELSPIVQVLGMAQQDCKLYGTLSQKIFKLLGGAWSRVFGNDLPVRFALLFQRKISGYDVVISYHQETSRKTLVTGFGKFALKKCEAPIKVAWVHADFLSTSLATDANHKTYTDFDKIVCVSKTTKDHFVKAYPDLKDKTDYCYNYLPAEDIISKSKEKEVVLGDEDDIVLFSAGRLVEEKGYVEAALALVPLMKMNPSIKWFIAGVGPKGAELNQIIEENSLEENIILLGYVKNPYPYIKTADYLFLPSLHETFSMVVHEAHILGTKVMATDIPIMQEIVSDGDAIVSKDFKELADILDRGSIRQEQAFNHTIDKIYEKTYFQRCFESVLFGRGDRDYE